MDIEIIEQPLIKDIFGFSGVAVNRQYAAMGFKLTDKMWKVIKDKGLKHKGLNIWVYEGGNAVFAGIELEGTPVNGAGLELKRISLAKYAHYKHTGRYNKLGEIHSKALAELVNKGYENCWP